MQNKYLQIEHIWFTVFKGHHCPTCNTTLKKKLHSTIVSTSSPEARKYDFWIGDGYMFGEVQCYEVVFRCDPCNAIYTVSELLLLEKKKKSKASP